MMQGYDEQAAVAYIARAMRRAGHKLPQEALEAFVRRAIEADMRYMQETGVIDGEGFMGEGEYDDDEAFEALLSVLSEGISQEQEIDAVAQMLDSYMAAQQAFMEESGLMEEF